MGVVAAANEHEPAARPRRGHGRANAQRHGHRLRTTITGQVRAIPPPAITGGPKINGWLHGVHTMRQMPRPVAKGGTRSGGWSDRNKVPKVRRRHDSAPRAYGTIRAAEIVGRTVRRLLENHLNE